MLSFQTSKNRQSVCHISLQNVGGPAWCAPCLMLMMNPTTRRLHAIIPHKNLDPENVDGEGQRNDNQESSSSSMSGTRGYSTY